MTESPAAGGVGGRIVGSLGWSAIASMARPLFRYVTSIVVYRALGVEGFAVYILILSVADSLLFYSDLGITSTIQRFLPELGRRDAQRLLVVRAALAKLALLVAFIGTIVAFPDALLGAVGLSQPSAATIVVVCALTAERNISLLAEARLVASLMIRTVTINMIIFSALTAILAAASVALGADAVAVVAAVLVAESLQAASLVHLAWRPLPVYAPGSSGLPSFARVRRYFGSQLLGKSSRYTQGPAFAALALGAFSATGDVADFGLIFTLVSGVLGVAAAPIARLATTLVASGFAISPRQGAVISGALATVAIAIAAPIAVTLAGFGRLLIELIYGSGAEVPMLSLAAISVALVVVFTGGVSVTTLQNLERFRIVNSLALISLAVGAALVPLGASSLGTNGAAVGLAVASCVAYLPPVVIVHRSLRTGPTLALVLRVLAGCVPIALAALFADFVGVSHGVAVLFAVPGLVLGYGAFRALGGIGAEYRSLLLSADHRLSAIAARYL